MSKEVNYVITNRVKYEELSKIKTCNSNKTVATPKK